MNAPAVIFAVLTVANATGPPAREDTTQMESKDKFVVVFTGPQAGSWIAVNDGVMGGLSQSRLRATDRETAVFSGIVSLENNGGFASVRTALGEVDLSAYDRLVVRVFGDGKRYRLRLRTDDRFDGVAYQASFDTSGDDWQQVELPFASFRPTFRGRIASGAPPLDPSKIRQLGVMIADKQKGPFRLEIAWVKAYAPPPGTAEDR